MRRDVRSRIVWSPMLQKGIPFCYYNQLRSLGGRSESHAALISNLSQSVRQTDKLMVGLAVLEAGCR